MLIQILSTENEYMIHQSVLEEYLFPRGELSRQEVDYKFYLVNSFKFKKQVMLIPSKNIEDITRQFYYKLNLLGYAHGSEIFLYNLDIKRDLLLTFGGGLFNLEKDIDLNINKFILSI